MIVRVPATSANLGPGFDCFGMAWQRYNEIHFEKSDCLEITGCNEKYSNPDNLAYIGYKRVLHEYGIQEDGVRIHFGETNIPVSRGLGSSAALISAGVVAADAIYGLNMPDHKKLAIATAIEGHPDNIAPALFGGLTVSVVDEGIAYTSQFPVSDKLHFTIIVPNYELSTTLARSVLPPSYSRQDVVFNVSRATLMIRAMADGDVDLIKVAIKDKIHQPYRTALIKGYEEVKSIALNCGAAGLCISGAGSTLLAISEDENTPHRLALGVHELFPQWDVFEGLLNTQGAEII